MVEPGIYTVGGTVQTNEQGLYISRPADAELLNLCQQGEFAFVLTPRQMGKSSLMIRTAEQWIEAGGQAVIIDLALIGTQLTAEQWYRGLLTPIAEQLMLRVSLDNWWRAHSNLGLTQRLTLFLQQVVLAEVQEPVVIFVDEIDTTLSLDFTDDFFVAIRSLYVARTTQPELRRLSFVLIGVAMPGDLIRDPQRTPFNIGHRVDLTDFTLAEAMPLATGLGLTEAAAEQTLGWVLKWTGGHPYLTQRLCQEMAQVGGSVWTQSEVDRLVRRTFLGVQSEQDNNLQFVRNMLTQRATEPVAVLQTYRQIRRGKPTVVDEEQSLVKSHLKLSGVVKRVGKTLRVRNQIYREVFDQRWIKEHLPENLWQRLKPAMPLIATLSVSLAAVSGLAVYALGQRDAATSQRDRADKALKEAREQTRIADEQRQRAEVASQQAKIQKDIAIKAATDAKHQRNQAKLQAEIAQKAQANAEQQREVAQTERNKAEQQTVIAQEQRQKAEQQTRIAFARQLAAQAQALQSDDPSLIQTSVLMAIEAVQRFQAFGIRSLQADQVLREGITILPHRVSKISYQFQDNSDLYRLTEPSIKFSANGKYLFIATNDALQVLETRTGRKIKQIKYASRLKAFSFSSNGNYLALADNTNKIKVLELPNSKEIAAIPYREELESMSLSSSGKYLIIKSKGSNGQIWNLSKAEKIVLSNSPVSWDDSEFVLTPDEKYLGIENYGGENSIIFQFWELASGKEINKLDLPKSEYSLPGISSVLPIRGSLDRERNQDLRYILIGDIARGFLQAWDIPFGKAIKSNIENGQWLVGDFVERRSFSRDSQYLAAGNRNGDVLVWDLSTGRQTASIKHGNDWIGVIVFSPNGQYLVTSEARDEMTRIWKMPSGREVGRIFEEQEAENIEFSPDSRSLAVQEVVGYDKNKRFVVSLWNSVEVPEVGTLQTFEYKHNEDQNSVVEAVKAINFSPDGEYLAIAEGNCIHLIDTSKGQELLYFTHAGVKNVVFSPSGKYLATIGLDKTIRIWNRSDGRELLHILNNVEAEDSTETENVSFSSDEKYITSFKSNISRTWSLLNGKEIKSWKKPVETSEERWASADGKYSINVIYEQESSRKGYISVRDTFSSKEFQSIQLPRDLYAPGTGYTLSPNGKYLVAFGGFFGADSTHTRDGRVYVWEVSSGKQIMRLEEPKAVSRVFFSSDNNYLIGVIGDLRYSMGQVNVVKIWELSSKQEIIRIKQDGDINDVILSSNGKYLAINRNTYTDNIQKSIVQVWLQKPKDLVELACKRVTRNLTLEEWHRYFGVEPYRKICLNLPAPQRATTFLSASPPQQGIQKEDLLVSMLTQIKLFWSSLTKG